MRRSRFVQVTAAVLALLFLGTQAAELYGLHSCPRHHHRGLSMRQAEPGGPSALVAVPAGEESSGGDAGLPVCTCVGSCCSGAAAPVPSRGRLSATAVAPRLAEATSARDRAARTDRSSYLLPFPNGPPLA